MAYDMSRLTEIARANPGSLSADQKNALLAFRLGESVPEPPAAPETVEIKESVGAFDYDPDMYLSDSTGGTPYMRRLTTNARRKDLTPLQQERMIKIAAYLWDRNPLAARIIKRAVNYVLGEGVEIQAEDDDEDVRAVIQDVIDEFWFDPRNRMDRRLIRWATAWRAYGELCLTTTVNPVDGRVRMAYVSPEMILKVKTEKDDIEQIEEIRVMRGEGDDKGQAYKAIRVWEDKDSPLPPGAQPRLQGDAFYFATNVLPDMVRGRSDLLAIADVIDAYDQFVWNRLERQAMLLAFVWSVQLKGADEKAIRKWIDENGGTPRPGSLQVHNEQVSWNAVSPQLGSGEAQQEGDMLINYMATSQGMPGMWFGKEQDPNRANGENLTGPTLKDLTNLQNEFKELIASIITFVIDQAVLHNRLPAHLVTRKAFTINFPDLSVTDMAATASTIGAMANALIPAQQAGLIDLESAQKVFLQAIAPTGVDIDLEEMRERIEAEKEEKAEKASMMPYGMNPGDDPNGPLHLGTPKEGKPGEKQPLKDRQLSEPGRPRAPGPPPPLLARSDGSERRPI